MDDRITELEIRFMEQNELLRQLNEVVFAQQQELNSLRADFRQLAKKLEAEPPLTEGPPERPPHY